MIDPQEAAMTHRKSNFEEIHTSFREWLLQSGLSKKVAGDTISRCNRIEQQLNLSLPDFVQTKEGYLKLIELITDYALTASTSPKSARELKGSLLRSARLFAEFLIGDEAAELPNGYRFKLKFQELR